MSIWIKDHGRLFNLRVPNNLKIIYQPLKGLSLFSNKNFGEGDKILFKNKIVKFNKASPEAVQIDKQHFLDTYNYVPTDFINHSCNQNTKIDIQKSCFMAIKNIPKNTEITFNYLTTEYDMKKLGTDFVCRCGSKNCYGHIRGFKYLTLKQKLKLKPYLSPFLLGKLET